MSKGRDAFSGSSFARGERPHGVEPGDADRRDGGFDSSRYHGVAKPVPNHVKRLAYGMSAGRTGGLHGEVGALGPMVDGDESGGHVADEHGDEEGAEFLGAGFQEDLVAVFNGGESSKPAAHDYAGPFRKTGTELQSGIFEGKPGGPQSELQERVHLSEFFSRDELLRPEILDLGGDLRGEGARVESG